MGIRADFLQSSLATGEPVRAQTTDLVLEAGAWLSGRGADRWDADDVLALAWYGVLAWCRLNAVAVPSDAAATVRRLAEYLDPDGQRGLVPAVSEVVDPVARSARRRPSRPSRSA